MLYISQLEKLNNIGPGAKKKLQTYYLNKLYFQVSKQKKRNLPQAIKKPPAVREEL